jgi:tetratricopeptide (TPR) repeat protein
MPVAVDHYATLSVARNADFDALEAAVKKAMREWRKRTEAADLSVRQEAELKVKQIEEARTVLLDSGRRARYDQDLAGGVKETVRPTADSGNGQTWLERAEGYLAVGDYHSAAYAAREATHVEGQKAKTWWIRSRANAGLGLWQDALYEARQATMLEDSNAEYHFNLGLIHEQMNAYGDAVTEYRRAGTCDPSNPMYELAVGGVFASNGKPEEARRVIEAVYKKHPRDANANYYLGSVLIQLAEEVPASKTGDGYIVKSDEEIKKMRDLCERAKGLNIVDDETRTSADHILRYLNQMEVKSFRPPWSLVGLAAGWGGEMGVFGAILASSCAIAVLFAPIILFFSSFGQMGENPGRGFLLLVLGVGLGWVWFKLMYVPKWKHARRAL